MLAEVLSAQLRRVPHFLPGLEGAEAAFSGTTPRRSHRPSGCEGLSASAYRHRICLGCGGAGWLQMRANALPRHDRARLSL